MMMMMAVYRGELALALAAKTEIGKFGRRERFELNTART